MAYYDLHCTACGEDHFDVQATVQEKTQKLILCPGCGSNQLEKIYSPVSIHVKSTAGDAACPNSGYCGASCPHQARF